MDLTAQQIDLLVDEALKHSDQQAPDLVNAAKVLVQAHDLVPDGPSLEIGTRHGGSAFLFLNLLLLIYDGMPPQFFTVDPYGNKPYQDASSNAFCNYGRLEQAEMKTLLLPFHAHAHFQLRSSDFLQALRGRPYWLRGKQRCFGERDMAFAFLDGDHDAESIRSDLHYLWGWWMHPKGLVLIDNVDKDPKTIPMLESSFAFERSATGIQATVTGRKT